MARRKPAPVVTRHGATQPEIARARKQMLLRLTPHVAGILRDQAAEQGIAVSGLVAELVTRTWGHLYESDAS